VSTAQAIKAEGLRKTFGEVVACAGVDLTVSSGEIVGLLGPDGAGKTTTMRILCGILRPDSGSAHVAGHDVLREPEAVKRRIGYLPQRFSLHRDLTVDENIRYFADLYEAPRGAWEERREELLEITYMKPFRARQAGRLSGGMRQKLSLLCTLIHRPEVVLLDEPTTGVDPVSRRDFWKILYDLPRQGVTLLITTPYMDEASRCNRVALMYEGAVIAADTPAALREAIPGAIYEVSCRPQRTAREALKACPDVASVEVFGDRLHILMHPGADAEPIRKALAQAGVDCQRIQEAEPSLEDAFMTMVTERHGI
jgi:ABC-2 type transport system ATP-binding protein